jgi:hypothetical protein
VRVEMKGQGEDASGLLCYFFAEEERENGGKRCGGWHGARLRDGKGFGRAAAAGSRRAVPSGGGRGQWCCAQ